MTNEDERADGAAPAGGDRLRRLADQLLVPGQMYLWGDKLFQANRDSTWSLLPIDRQTNMPPSHIPGAVVSYILMRGNWYEVLAAEKGQHTVGAIVDIDLTQFKDIAASISTEFVDGHVYSDGKHMFIAAKSNDFVLELHRLNIVNGVLVMPIIADSIAGYLQDNKGIWHVLKVGDQHTRRRMVLLVYPEFESEILPKLKHVADSARGFLYGR